MQISGALSISPFRIMMRIAVLSMVSAVKMPVKQYAGSHYIDHPVSFTAVEGPTEEEAFWPFGPTDEPVDTSGLFRSFGGVSGEVTGDSLFMVEEEPTQQPGFRERIVGVWTAMNLALVMLAILHYLRLSFGNSLRSRVVMNTYGQPKNIRDITSTEDGSALKVGPTARSRTGRNDCVNVLVDDGASGYYFDDAIIPGFRDRLEEYKVLDLPCKISTAEGGCVNSIAQGVLRGHVIDDKRMRRLNPTLVSDCASPRT